jgi:hypothetical protein
MTLDRTAKTYAPGGRDGARPSALVTARMLIFCVLPAGRRQTREVSILTRARIGVAAMAFTVKVNGNTYSIAVGGRLLAWVLRDVLGIMGLSSVAGRDRAVLAGDGRNTPLPIAFVRFAIPFFTGRRFGTRRDFNVPFMVHVRHRRDKRRDGLVGPALTRLPVGPEMRVLLNV